MARKAPRREIDKRTLLKYIEDLSDKNIGPMIWCEYHWREANGMFLLAKELLKPRTRKK